MFIMHYYCPGQKHTTPHLHIPGMTEKPVRLYQDHGKRRALKLCVFINLCGGVLLFETTGTDYGGYKPGKGYTTKKNEEAHSITAEEYNDYVREAVKTYNKNPSFRKLRNKVLLIHDRSRVHSKGSIEGVPWEVAMHPPRSPDLMPLDYGVFGTAKNEEVRISRSKKNFSWEERVSTFKTILKEYKGEHTIKQYPKRLKACINNIGYHFEDSLKRPEG